MFLVPFRKLCAFVVDDHVAFAVVSAEFVGLCPAALTEHATSLHRGIVRENVLDCDTSHINCGIEPRADSMLRNVRPTSGEHLVQEPKNGAGVGICGVVVDAKEMIDI